MRKRPGPAVDYFLFHDLSEQHPISREEWRKLYKSSGFRSIEEDYLAIAPDVYNLYLEPIAGLGRQAAFHPYLYCAPRIWHRGKHARSETGLVPKT